MRDTAAAAANHPVPWHLWAAVAGACLGLTVAAYALGVGPLLREHERDRALAAELEERRETVARLASSTTDLRRDLAAAQAELERAPLRLQPASRVNQRLEAVARLATESGLALDEVRPGGPVDAAHYQTVPIRIVGFGRYPACATFLRELRQTFGDMGVRTFSASNSAGAAAAAAAGAGSTALFQAELVWFTELPRD